MRKKFRLSSLPDLSNILLIATLYSFCVCIYSVSAQQNNTLNDNAYKVSVLQRIAGLLETKYVYPDLAKKYAAEFKKEYELGSYDSYTNRKKFAKRVTADLINITKDKHINFRPIESSEIGEKTESALHHPIRYHHLSIKENKGFSKLEWIDGNIGYLDVRRFYYISDIKEMADAAIQFLSNANAIIIDIRKNGGGSGDYLSNYFLNHPTQLTSWYSSEDDFLTEFWTSKESGVARLTDVPLFLLTSKKTFSASESFAYEMKVRNRAVIIGDSTKGGAHSVDLYKIDDQFEIYISTVRAINPVTGENWEGTGVVPDIIVPSKFALDTAIVLAKKAGDNFAEVRESKLKLAVEKMQIHLENAETLFRNSRQDDAESALNSVFQIAAKSDLINEFFMDVLAYNYSSPEDEQILYAVLQKKIEFFPESPTAYETLAYAYYRNDKTEQATAHYKKMLELDPGNRNARKMIERMQKE